MSWPGVSFSGRATRYSVKWYVLACEKEESGTGVVPRSVERKPALASSELLRTAQNWPGRAWTGRQMALELGLNEVLQSRISLDSGQTTA